MLKKSNIASVHPSVVAVNCGVFGLSVVGAGVTLQEHAMITGHGRVLSDADCFVQGPGPSGAYTTAHRDALIGVRINSRCYTGTVEGFRARLDKDATVTPEQRATALEYIENINAHFEL